MVLAAAPQLLDHPCCDFINQFPWGFFLAVHIVLFALGAYFALRAFDGPRPLLGWGFGLFALAELVYLTYHINITQFLFAHTIAEVLDALAFVTLFVGVKDVIGTRASRPNAAAAGSVRSEVTVR